jgi:G6PDH family F420-dependent oxidoreductase
MTEFGYFLSGEELSPSALVDLGPKVSEAGLDRVWVSDHFHPWLEAQGESPFVWSVLGALAATTDLTLTTAVTCPIMRIHPVVNAQAVASTACLAPGRFRFGVGTGERLNEHVTGAHWPPVDTRLEMLEEAIGIMRRLWDGETVNHDGEHYTVETATVFSRPESPPPVLMSAFGPEATDVAARIADGYVNTSPDQELLQRYRGKGGQGISQAGTKVCWAPTEAEAIETARTTWGHSAIGGPASQELAVPEHFQPLADAATDEQIKDSVPCGPDPDQAAESIRAYVDAGFDEVYVAQMGPRQEEGLRFIVEDVLPRV